jgi:hypothetical protein
MESKRMTDPFSISCDWISPQAGPAEIAETSALIEIKVGERLATRAENDFSGSITSRPSLAAYPLALWFAASWWRLRWESVSPIEPRTEWRMSHDMPAAGGGFVWPVLTFLSDGEAIEISSRPSVPSALEPLHYLEEFNKFISARDFEKGVDQFVELVCARLTDRGVQDTPLQRLWREVCTERSRSELSQFRHLEAILGFDPDEGQPGLIEEFIKLSTSAGPSAVEEIAYASAGNSASTVLNTVVCIAQRIQLDGKINVSRDMKESALRIQSTQAPPWERGWRLADDLRRSEGLNGRPLTDKDLGELLQLPAKVFGFQGSMSPPPPMSIAVRKEDNDRVGFFFRKRHSTGRRFEAARLLGDYVIAPNVDRWFPATDADTARQKVQRAFAAELLCPIDELRDMLKGEFSDDAILDASEHFQVSPLMVRAHLVNHRVQGSEHLAL